MFMYHNNNITFQSQIKINSTITAWKLPHYHCAYTLASGITQNEQLPLAQARPTMLAFTSYYNIDYYYSSRHHTVDNDYYAVLALDSGYPISDSSKKPSTNKQLQFDHLRSTNKRNCKCVCVHVYVWACVCMC